MARTRGTLHFAPGIPFEEVDINSPKIIPQFCCRLEGFYLQPAKNLIAMESTFSAGVLIICCMDALSRYDPAYRGLKKHRHRFPEWVVGEMKSFDGDRNIARQFYRAFRCGLVHEARIKAVGEFTLDTGMAVVSNGTFLVVNPDLLLADVTDALHAFAGKLKNEKSFLADFQNELQRDFAGHFRIR